jgi:NDP-sugar pyrophosphorylase family protein
MNGGIYFLKKKVLKIINNKTFSLEEDLIPFLIKNNLIRGKYFNSFFIDIGTKNNLNQIKKNSTIIFQKTCCIF